MKIKKIKEKKYNLIINKKKMKTKNLMKRIKNQKQNPKLKKKYKLFLK